MKKLYLIVVTILFSLIVTAQTDSTFYYLDKSGLTNNVLCNFNDTIYFGLYDGMHDQQIKKMFSLQILSDLNHFTFGLNDKPLRDSLKSMAVVEKRDNNKIPVLIPFNF